MKSCVIIITYNGMQWINECLQSILDSSISATIIVVDNCSSDSTADHIKTNFSTVILLEQKENLGFGKANNIGIKEATGKYVCLINSDVVVPEEKCEILKNYMRRKKIEKYSIAET